MPDDRSKQGPADRLQINVNQDYDVQYWTKELGISAAELRELVKKHGVMAADVRIALKKRKR